MAHMETQWRVVVEFLRASQAGSGRIIRLNHSPGMLPPQLAGRLHPVRACWHNGPCCKPAAAFGVSRPSLHSLQTNFPTCRKPCSRACALWMPAALQGFWQAFMEDAGQLSLQHPFTAKPTAKDYCNWAACFGLGAVVGLFCINPDAGGHAGWGTHSRHECTARRLLQHFDPRPPLILSSEHGCLHEEQPGSQQAHVCFLATAPCAHVAHRR